MVFEKIHSDQFEQIIFCQDSSVGLKAIIAIHSTALGPATGGCRMWNYTSEGEALTDVFRLSRGMTYKASFAGLNWGGGKSVILGDPRKDKASALLERFGEFVDRLNGHYITAKDVGMGSDDLRAIKRKTPYVLGIEGERTSSGSPSPATALGVYYGMRACSRFALGTSSLRGVRVALQGLGSVSMYLIEHLKAAGAIVIGCDIDPVAVTSAVREYQIEVVPPSQIYDVECDIFSPCALGATINSDTIPRITAKIIAGSANNQLALTEDGRELMRRGIVYAPDYAINAGGLINIYYEDSQRGEYHKAKALDHVGRIENAIYGLLERAKDERQPTHEVADRIAEERIARVKSQRT